MKIEYRKHYSHHLGRDMEYKVYGHAGKPVMFIPCQAGRFWDFESFKMIDYWAKWIEAGQCIVYSVDTIDNEAWANKGGDGRTRIQNHENWFNYICNEVVPIIKGECWNQGIMTFGASMGAMHAANLYYRRPDLFDSCFAISGLYDHFSNKSSVVFTPAASSFSAYVAPIPSI